MSLAASRLRDERPDESPDDALRVARSLFHAVAAGLLNGSTSWQAVLNHSNVADSDLLKRHAYERLLEPLLTRDEERLSEGGREAVQLWAAVTNFCEWLTRTLCAAREQGWIRYDARRESWLGAERLIAGGFERWCDFRKEGWTAPVRLHGFADVLVCEPFTGHWMYPEFAPPDTVLDAWEPAIHRELLSSTATRPEVGIIRFTPELQQYTLDSSTMEAAREKLIRAAGAMAGVALETPEQSQKYAALGDELVRAFSGMNVQVTRCGEPVIAPGFVRYELMPGEQGAAELLNAAEDLGAQIGMPAPLMTPKNGRVRVDIARVDDFEEIPFSRVTQALPPLDASSGSSLIPIGFDLRNRLRGFDLNESNLLVAGGEASERAAWLRMVAGALMLTNTPSTLRFVLIDSGRGAFTGLEASPHLLYPGSFGDCSRTFASDQLDTLIGEMESRQSQFETAGVADILTWRQRWGNRMPRIVCLIDEVSEARERRRVMNALLDLGPRARAAGIHLIVATESPDSKVLSTRVRSQFRARMCFKVATAGESRLILRRDGAERLLGQGDLLFLLDSTTWRFQAPEFSESEQAGLLAGRVRDLIHE